MPYKDIAPPPGEKITRDQKLTVPDNPIIPFIRGDGTGPDIWAASVRVFDAAVKKAYGGKKKIAWFEVFAGQAAKDKFDNWLPDDTVEAFREYLVGIKGPLTTPVGGGIRSLNVALRQTSRSLRLSAPGAVFSRRPLARETSGEGQHGDLPRKHGGHLRRHRIRGRHSGSAEDSRFLREGISEGVQEDPFRHKEKAAEFWKMVGAPEKSDVMVGIGIKPVSRSGSVPLDPQRHQLRDPEQAQERHVGPQGQHHEVHRRRVSRLGLRNCEELFRRGRDRRRPVVQDSRWANRAAAS